MQNTEKLYLSPMKSKSITKWVSSINSQKKTKKKQTRKHSSFLRKKWLRGLWRSMTNSWRDQNSMKTNWIEINRTFQSHLEMFSNSILVLAGVSRGATETISTAQKPTLLRSLKTRCAKMIWAGRRSSICEDLGKARRVAQTNLWMRRNWAWPKVFSERRKSEFPTSYYCIYIHQWVHKSLLHHTILEWDIWEPLLSFLTHRFRRALPSCSHVKTVTVSLRSLRYAR